MSKGVCITLGLLTGAALGAGLVLLFAPQSGAETQGMIRERVQAVLEEGQQAADLRRQELTARFEDLKRSRPAA